MNTEQQIQTLTNAQTHIDWAKDAIHADRSPLAELSELENARAIIEAQIQRAVRAARHRGDTWSDVAEALDLNSPQAAHKRYAHLV